MAQIATRLSLSNTFTDAGTHLTDVIDVRVQFSTIVQTVFTYDPLLTSVQITIQGSVDGITYTDIDVQTVTENGDLMFCLSLCPVPLLRIRVVTVGTGDFVMATHISKAA